MATLQGYRAHFKISPKTFARKDWI